MRTCWPELRETIPGSSVSSDFIVGFCGETEESFQKTVGLVERSRFKNSFIFKYSAREPARRPTTLFADDVPEEVKKRRNHELLAIQTAISLEDNGRSWGGDEVLVEGRSRSTTRREGWDGVDQLSGRTHCDRIVVFEGPERLIGRMVQVRIENASAVTLFGQVDDDRADCDLGCEGIESRWPCLLG